MNFSYGVIIAVGVLVAVSIGLILMSPDETLQPRTSIDPCQECHQPSNWNMSPDETLQPRMLMASNIVVSV